MSTVEEAVDDVSGLHCKIDRKKNVEDGNRVGFEEFKQVREGGGGGGMEREALNKREGGGGEGGFEQEREGYSLITSLITCRDTRTVSEVCV